MWEVGVEVTDLSIEDLVGRAVNSNGVWEGVVDVNSMLLDIDGILWWEMVGEKVQERSNDFTECLLKAFVSLTVF